MGWARGTDPRISGIRGGRKDGVITENRFTMGDPSGGEQ